MSPVTPRLSEVDQEKLSRVLDVIRAEADDAQGFLGGFLEGLGEHIALIVAAAPVPFV